MWSVPPFPSRLLANPNDAKTTTTAQTSSSGSSARRIRPVAVAPPPGFERRPTGSSSTGTGQEEERACGSVGGGGYAAYAQARAISGALAGDWTTGRPLPDIPAVLTAALIHPSTGIASPERIALFARSSLHAPAAPDVDLVSFCRANNIASNLPTPDPALLPKHIKDTLDSRFLAPTLQQHVSSTAHHHVDMMGRRRLAPTQITADKMFSIGPLDHANVWQPPPEQLPKKPSDSFQKTPRAPRASSKLPQDNRHSSSVGPRNFTYFEKMLTKDGDLKVKTPPSTSPNPSLRARISPQSRSGFTPVLSQDPSTNVSSAQPSPPKSQSTLCRSDNEAVDAIEKPGEITLEHRLAQRQKQLNIGKNTPEYYNYRRQVKKKSRKRGDPMTPDKFQIISKRNWEGQVKAWRRRLHEWDPLPEPAIDASEPMPEKQTSFPPLEDGEVPFWQQEDEDHLKSFGGLQQFETIMLNRMKKKMDEERLKTQEPQLADDENVNMLNIGMKNLKVSSKLAKPAHSVDASFSEDVVAEGVVS